MKKYSALILVAALAVFMTALPLSSSAAEEENIAVEENAAAEPGFNIARLVIAGSVEGSEPVGAVNVFSSSTEKVYCFLEARDIVEDTKIFFVWYRDDANMATVELSLRKGSRWRTYSSKKLAGRTGNWTVELQDANGNLLETVAFSVE
jgi:hypothetical protein